MILYKIPFTNQSSYETISKIFDDNNTFFRPKCAPIENFLKDEDVEGLDADCQPMSIGWEFKLENIV